MLQTRWQIPKEISDIIWCFLLIKQPHVTINSNHDHGDKYNSKAVNINDKVNMVHGQSTIDKLSEQNTFHQDVEEVEDIEPFTTIRLKLSHDNNDVSKYISNQKNNHKKSIE